MQAVSDAVGYVYSPARALLYLYSSTEPMQQMAVTDSFVHCMRILVIPKVRYVTVYSTGIWEVS